MDKSIKILAAYRAAKEALAHYELPSFGPVLKNAQSTVHNHEYTGTCVFMPNVVHQDLADVYKYGACLPLRVADKEVGLVIRLTRHTSSVAGIVFTWTNESGIEGDFHVHYILDNGVTVSMSTLYTVDDFEKMNFYMVKEYFIKGVKWAAIKNFVEVHYLSPSRVVPKTQDMVRLDAFIPASRRRDERDLWEYEYRGEQTCNVFIPNARRKRLLKQALASIQACVSAIQ